MVGGEFVVQVGFDVVQHVLDGVPSLMRYYTYGSVRMYENKSASFRAECGGFPVQTFRMLAENFIAAGALGEVSRLFDQNGIALEDREADFGRAYQFALPRISRLRLASCSVKSA